MTIDHTRESSVASCAAQEQIRAAVVQMTSGSDLAQNLSACEQLLKEAKQKGATLVALPENFAFFGHCERDKIAVAEITGQGIIQDFLSTQARRHGLWLVAGTIPIQTGSGERTRAASLLFDDHGRCVSRYDKMHTFDVVLPNGEDYLESSSIEPGDNPVATTTPFGRLALSVCYDLRFPEFYRQWQAEIITVVSAFTEATGKAGHWHTLLRARAIENLCYVVAPNQAGTHPNGRRTYGHSLIVGPWGEVLAEIAHDRPGIALAEIDLGYLGNLRRQFPVLQHRRL